MQVSGFVQSIRTNHPNAGMFLRHRVSLQLREADSFLHVLAPTMPPRVKKRLRLGEVRVRGVNIISEVQAGDNQQVLWVESWDDIDVLREGPPEPFARPVFNLEQVSDSATQTGMEPLRLRGRIVDAGDRKIFRLAHTFGPLSASVRCRQNPTRFIQAGDVVDVLGYPLPGKPEGVEFDVVDMRWLGLQKSASQSETDAAPLSEFVPVATSIRRIRDRSDEELAAGWPVRIFGTATHPDESQRHFYLNVGGGYGVRIEWPGTNALPTERDGVFVSGLAKSDVSQPIVLASEVKTTGSNARLEPRWPAASVFASGEFTHGLVALKGIVRSVETIEDNLARLLLAFQGDKVRVEIPLHDRQLPQQLVGALVNIRGIAIARKIAQRAHPEEILQASGPAALKVVDWPINDPFNMERRTVKSVLRKYWRETDARLLRVQGVVTAAGDDRLILDDGTGGIELRILERPPVEIGAEINVIGFPEPGRIVPHLANVQILPIAQGTLPTATELKAKEVLASDVNGRRIRTRGRIVDTLLGQQTRLELRADGQRFSATFLTGASGALPKPWRVGSEVELTGVCKFYGAGPFTPPENFRILLSGEGDIIALSQPPWWTAERLAIVSGALLLLVLAALGWTAFFRNTARQNRTQFLTTFHANPMPAWIIRRDNRQCLEVNREFETLFGLARDEFVGRTMQEVNLWNSDANRQAFLKNVAANPSLRAIEAKLQHQDGRTRSVLLSSEPIMVGREESLLLIAYDITDRLKLLEQLRQAQKMEAVGQLAAGVAHDFNNLLTVVRGNSGLIQLKENLDDDTCILTREIEDAGSRAAALTSQLLAFSRKSVMQRRAIDLNEVARSAGGMLKRVMEETIEVSYRCANEALPVKADSGMLDQVLLNMAVNSRDAMPDGGKFSIITRRADFTAKNLPANPDSVPGQYAVLEVSDSGAGMEPDVRERVFEPFFTTKDVGKGTGLGLSTAYGILRQHGGWIDLRSEPGRGSTFTIYLPITDSVQRNHEGEAPSDILGRGEETILVVEDEDSVRHTVRRALKYHGYTVLEAENGPAAQAIWKEQRGHIDLLLTDMVMPNGMSGFDVARRLQDDQPELKVIYMTGHSQDLVEHGGKLVAGVDFLPKPFENRDLVRIIRERLDSNGAAVNNP